MALPMESGASGPVCSAKRGKSVSSDKASGTSDSPAVRVMARPAAPREPGGGNLGFQGGEDRSLRAAE